MSTYFPIFRGKQYELIAVREFAEARPKNARIHPVVEPVRNPTDNAGLSRMVAALEENEVKYTIIVNPSKGHMADDDDAIKTIIGHLEDSSATVENLSFGILFHAGGASDHAVELIGESALSGAQVNLLYDSPAVGPGDAGKLEDLEIAHHIVEDKRAVRILEVFPPDPTYVQLLRTFKRRGSNVEYVGEPPSVFCSAHLFLEDDGYTGLADYLTIGDEYSESGALPLALVIHLTYRDPDSKLIYIRHFHSTTNHDQSDPAGKFREAVDALVGFIDDRGLDNPALAAFRAYHQEKRFPGLGMIKKLSMQNHLYVMDDALANQ